MACVICGRFSWRAICFDCRELLKPDIKVIDNTLSFYKYENISHLLKYKYTKFGSRVFWEISEVLKTFGDNFSQKAFLIPVDDRVKKGYSHTAVMAKKMKTSKLKPLFGVLHSKNSVRYAGKSLEFRLNNPRDFRYSGPEKIDVILVDDIITTGFTLQEAENVLKTYGVNVVLKVVLARGGD